MANNKTPDFAVISRETGQAATDAIQLIWTLLNNQIRVSQSGLLVAMSRLEPYVYAASPTSTQTDIDIDGASIVHYTGSTNFTLTGWRSPDPGKARVVILHNSGTATITVKNEATSLTSNQFHLKGGADKTVGQDDSLIFVYLASKWRDITTV